MSKPFVSIIMTTYNQEKYIRQAIDGVLFQITDFPYELIIGEDCSSDSTLSIVEEYQKQYPDRIHLITSPANVGMRANELRCLKAATGKYIAYCEGDDYWIHPDKLQIQTDRMEEDPEISMSFHAILNDLSSLSMPNQEVHYHVGDHYFDPWEVIHKGGEFFKFVSTMVRHEIFNQLPEWYIESPVGDAPLVLMALNYGKIYYIDRMMSAYRVGVNESWTNKMEKSAQAQIDHFLKMGKMRKEFDQWSKGRYSKWIKATNSQNYRNNLIHIPMKLLNRIKLYQRLEDELLTRDKIQFWFSIITLYPVWRTILTKIHLHLLKQKHQTDTSVSGK